MKVEYFKIHLLLDLLFSTKEENEILKIYEILRSESKKYFIRFEIFYDKEYYQNKVGEFKDQIKRRVENNEYELAAMARDSKNIYEGKVREIEKHFNNQKPPNFIIDVNGLVRCYLHYNMHQNLISFVHSLA